jgi:hypothetical protein
VGERGKRVKRSEAHRLKLHSFLTFPSAGLAGRHGGVDETSQLARPVRDQCVAKSSQWEKNGEMERNPQRRHRSGLAGGKAERSSSGDERPQ